MKNRVNEGLSVKRDSVEIYAFQFAALAVSLITSVIVARVLGPSGKGVVDAYLLLTMLIAELATLGFGNGLFYYQSKGSVAISVAHGSVVAYCFLAGVASALLGWMLLPLWQQLFPNLAGWMILTAFLSAPLLLYRGFWSSLMSGINRVVTPYRLNFVISGVSLAILSALALTERLSPVTAIVATVLILVFTVGLYLKGVLRLERKFAVDSKLIRKSTTYGFVIFLGTIANALHFKIDQIMINVWLGSDQLGIYATAIRWAEFLFILDSAIGSAAIFRIGSSSAEKSQLLVKKLILVQFLISAAAGLLLAFFARSLIVLLYGPEFEDAAWPLITLIPGIVFWSVSKLASTHFSYNRKQAHVVVSIAIVGAGLNALLNVLFILGLEMGLIGAALASTLSYSAVAGFIILRFYFGEQSAAQSSVVQN